MSAARENHPDVLVIGAGLAGLTLALHLLRRDRGLSVLVAERRAEVADPRQKVGEATVQVGGYYLSRVLGLEEHLLQRHYLKYNLRFLWPSGRGGERFEDYCVSHIRALSNVATYQLDRNLLEAEMLRRLAAEPGFTLHAGASGLEVDLDESGEGRHGFRFQAGGGEVAGTAGWVVDASGRARVLARRRRLVRPSPIRHGSSFVWVDGLVDPERLTERTEDQIRLAPQRAALGHLPGFLATNHFCGDGYWIWLIPLHGKTSIGLVYDAEKVSSKEVSTPAKLVEWICHRFPLFAGDLPHRRVLHHGGFTDFAYDCVQTLSPARWALTGEACRFSDPLYSPGGDLIAIYNTLIVDAVTTRDRGELERKLRLYEPLARAVYEAYVPSYAVSYATLGDQETFSLRYAWELSVYFAFYVFPFLNDLFTDTAFLPGYLRRFSRLGPINRGLHRFLAGYHRWRRESGAGAPSEPAIFDFTEVPALRAAEGCFYRVGVGAREAHRVLDEQLANLEELARWIVAHLSAVVAGDPDAASDAELVESIDFDALDFDAAEIARRWKRHGAAGAGPWTWRAEPPCMARFRAPIAETPRAAAGGGSPLLARGR